MWNASNNTASNYFDVVSEALSNENVFNNFKQDSRYSSIVI